MTQGKLIEPILNLLLETMPRNTLLNSACLDFFHFIKRERINNLIAHVVANYRDKVVRITYVDTFIYYLTRFDQTEGFTTNMESLKGESEEEAPKRIGPIIRKRWESGIKDLDEREEEYFNAEDELIPMSEPLVDYDSDEESELEEERMLAGGAFEDILPPPVRAELEPHTRSTTPRLPSTPPEKISEKRRREDDEEDGMAKLSSYKRRSSSGSNEVLRSKKRSSSSGGMGKSHKISISIGPAIKKPVGIPDPDQVLATTENGPESTSIRGEEEATKA